MHSPKAMHFAQDAQERRLFAWALLCGLLLWAAMSVPFYAGRVYTSDDLWAFHLPLRHFYAECLARGDRFDWSPLLFNGFYLTGEGQLGGYHPWHWLLYRTLSLRAAFDLELLLSYPCLLAGMYLFLRSLVGNRGAAMVGAVAFTFSGFNLLHFVHPNAIAIVAHVPWLLWLIHTRLRSSGRRAAWAAAGISLLTASQLLLGYPQYVWFSLLMEAAFAGYVLTGLSSDHRRSRRAIAVLILSLAGAKLLGLMVGAVQLLPTIEALAASERSAVDASFAQSGSLHPLNLVQLVAPYLFATRVAGQNTHELGLYAGAVPLMLVIWLVGQRGEWRSWRRAATFSLGLVIVAGWLALGQYGGLYKLQTVLPLIGNFRMPTRYIMLVHLGMAMLSAVAVALLMQRQNEEKASGWSELGPLWRAVALSGLIALAAPWVWSEEHLASPLLIWTGPLLMLAAATLVTFAARGRRWALAPLVVLTAIDLGTYGLSYAIYPNAVALEDYMKAGPTPPGDAGPLTQAASAVRIACDLPKAGETVTRAGNHLTVRGLRQTDGYAGLVPARRLDYSQVDGLRAAGVRWVLRHERTAQATGLMPHDRHWLEVPQSLPRVRLVGHAVASDNPASDLRTVDLTREALVPRAISLDGRAPGSVRVMAERPGELQLEVDAQGRQLLVVAESFHPGWQVWIDGRPTETLRVNGDFLGCVVEDGQHQARLRFAPAGVRWGVRLSWAGLALTGVCLIWQLRPTRRRPGEGRLPLSDSKRTGP